MAVMIGIDPHKDSHTAVAVGAAKEPQGKIRVRACPAQAEKLVGWAVLTAVDTGALIAGDAQQGAAIGQAGEGLDPLLRLHVGH